MHPPGKVPFRFANKRSAASDSSGADAPAWEQPVDIVSVQIPHPPPADETIPQDPRLEFQAQLTEDMGRQK